MLKMLVGCFGAVWLGGCACGPVLPAPTGATPAIRSELYFGQSILGGGEISAQQWNDFVTNKIVSCFPDGFSVFDAAGSWKDAQGSINPEASKALVVLYPRASAAEADKKLRALAEDYVREFHQESVLRDDTPAIMLFYTNGMH